MTTPDQHSSTPAQAEAPQTPQTFGRRDLLVALVSGVVATTLSGGIIDRAVHGRWLWETDADVQQRAVPKLPVAWTEAKGLVMPADLMPFNGHPEVTSDDRDAWGHIGVLAISVKDAKRQLGEEKRLAIARWINEPAQGMPAKIAAVGPFGALTRLPAGNKFGVPAAQTDSDMLAVGLRVGPGDLYATFASLDKQNRPQLLDGVVQLGETTLRQIAAEPDAARRIVVA